MTSIHNLFIDYFSWFERYFGNLAKEASRNSVSAAAIAEDFLENPGRRDKFQSDAMPQISLFINSFWKENSETVQNQVSKLSGMKARFGGDIGPQARAGVVQRAGLYFDTLVVPDPILRVSKIEEEVTKHKGYYLLKYIISQLLLKDYFLASVEPPLALLVGDSELIGEKADFDQLSEIGQVDSLLAINYLYDQELDSFEQAQEYMEKFSDIWEAARESKHTEKFWFEESSPQNTDDQINALLEDAYKNLDDSKLSFSIDSPHYLLFTILGRMMQANDVLQRSVQDWSHPLINAPVSYHWLSFKLQLNKQALEKDFIQEGDLDLAQTNAFLSSDLSWLANVPIDKLIQLRKNGALADMRLLLYQSISSLSNPNIDDISRVARSADHELEMTFRKHQEEVRVLDKDFREDLAINAPSLLASLAIALTPSLMHIPIEIKGIAAALTGTTSLRSILAKTVAYLRKRKRLTTSPTAILWSAKKNA
jgi:hypothetical protein